MQHEAAIVLTVAAFLPEKGGKPSLPFVAVTTKERLLVYHPFQAYRYSTLFKVIMAASRLLLFFL